jgi:hypothetical protein
MIVADPYYHPYHLLERQMDSFEVIEYGPEQNYALFWPQHAQQVKDFVEVMCVEHALLTVDERVVIRRDETVRK